MIIVAAVGFSVALVRVRRERFVRMKAPFIIVNPTALITLINCAMVYALTLVAMTIVAAVGFSVQEIRSARIPLMVFCVSKSNKMAEIKNHLF
jgi:hypothetical protein